MTKEKLQLLYRLMDDPSSVAPLTEPKTYIKLGEITSLPSEGFGMLFDQILSWEREEVAHLIIERFPDLDPTSPLSLFCEMCLGRPVWSSYKCSRVKTPPRLRQRRKKRKSAKASRSISRRK